MPDSRDAEIAALRQQVTNLSEALAGLSKLATAPRADPDSNQGYRPAGFAMLPSGQYVRVPMSDQDVALSRSEGFRWEGNTPVFPPHWPRFDPESGEKLTLI
jgi:hypothetical protein